MSFPRVVINQQKLESNVHQLNESLRAHHIEWCAVTKVVSAHPEVVRCIVSAGVTHLADSRLENLRALRTYFPAVELMMLRLPMISEASDVVAVADVSLNSEVATLRALDEAAQAQGKRHDVILMIDMGDLREGIWPSELPRTVTAIRSMGQLRLRGLGTNLACYGGVKPDRENLQSLLDAVRLAEDISGHPLPVISGGNSANWLALQRGLMPEGINHLRMGEALFLGTESVERTVIEGMYPDVFTLEAEVVELQVKPSFPVGELGQDAFGTLPQFEDRGFHRRAIVAVGRQDVVPEGLAPVGDGIRILGASSDHMILDVEDADSLAVGDIVDFRIQGYSSLLAVFTSKYVEKVMQ